MTAESNLQKAYRRRVLKGIAWLDQEEANRPSWLAKIDLDTFDIDSPFGCVLGQVYRPASGFGSGYWRKLEELDQDSEWARVHGFTPDSELESRHGTEWEDNTVLQDTWLRELRKLQNAVD